MSLRFRYRPNSWDSWAVDEVLTGIYTEKFGLRPTDMVADAGAHIGTFTVLAAPQVLKVFAFEPYPDSFRLLVDNVELNGISNAVLFEAALLDEPGETTIEERAPWHTGAAKTGEGNFPVWATTLDSEMRSLDFLKLDVEGAELKVLQGARKLLEGGNARIAAEIHPGNLKPVTKFLQSLGYTVESRRHWFVNHMLWARRPEC